ncbi:MAG: TonB-dependent receptor family protein [Gammaproteobacteria bacterium]
MRTRFALAFITFLLLSVPAGAAQEPVPAEPVAEDGYRTTEAPAAAGQKSVEMPVLEVIGKPDRQERLPGSAQVIARETLDDSRVMTTNEALRKAAGVNVRDEEGFGLRPNIGIRGLNPTRSTKVLLLEDGIPLAFAPYGDNASYYHPPVDRFDRIEVLKGAGQNIYGPQTVGGVINYITPAPPETLTSGVMLMAGNREYLNGRGYVGGSGMLLDYVRKQGDAARDNTHSELDDLNYKAVVGLGGRQALTVRANYYAEDSQLTYSGLTDAEYANFGREYNPFRNDYFEADRQGVSLTHEAPLGEATLITNLYGSRFNRDWWRQSSNTTFNPVGAADSDFTACQQVVTDRAAGTQVDPDTCGANIGNLRAYYSFGVEPRVRLAHEWFGAGGELEAGVRAHFEEQDRLQKVGDTATARSGPLAESNERRNQAWSAFVQNRFAFGSVALIPAVRVEHVRYERTNRCPNASGGSPQDPSACTAPVSGTSDITELVPSLGATWAASDAAALFAGVHRGFSPPSTADLINNSGVTVDLEAEQSWNYEIGARTRPWAGVAIEGTAFLNDFERQIAVGSIAAGSTPLATGQTRYEGAELLARAEFGQILDSAHNPFVELAWTWLPTADQESPFIRVDNGSAVTGSAAGNRLPYAPEDLLTATLGYQHPLGVHARLEAVHVGRQYADFANTASAAPNGNGQAGEIASYTIWNAALNYRLPATGFGVFVTAKNLLDKTYIADRTRGILPGAPRLVQAGVEYTF